MPPDLWEKLKWFRSQARVIGFEVVSYKCQYDPQTETASSLRLEIVVKHKRLC